MVTHIHFFKNKPGHFIAMVAPLLKPLSLQRGEYIFYKGDPNDACNNMLILSVFSEKGHGGSSRPKIPIRFSVYQGLGRKLLR